MEPLRVFIAKVRLLHVVATAVFALLFAVVIYLTDGPANSRADFLPAAMHSLVAIPIMIFTLAFLAFASSTRRFSASALFPSIFIVWITLAGLIIVDFARQVAAPPVILLLGLGTILSLMISGMICAIIAIRQRRGR